MVISNHSEISDKLLIAGHFFSLDRARRDPSDDTASNPGFAGLGRRYRSASLYCSFT